MSISYVGSTGWALDAWPQISVDAWGVDTVTMSYSGRSDTMDSFVSEFNRNRRLTPAMPTGFASYKYTTFHGIETEPGRAFSRARVIYKGVAGNRLPEPKSSSGFRANSATLQYIGDTAGETTGAVATFDYYAPYTTWWYVVRGKPQRASQRQILVTRDALTIINRSGNPGTLALFRGASIESSDIPLNSLDNVGELESYNGVIEGVVADFKFEQAGYDLWECQQTNEVRIVPLDMANSGLVHNL